MYLLTILNNETLHLVAEIGAIVIGSILMGIWLGYQYWGQYKKRVAQLANQVDFERNRIADLNIELDQLTLIRDHLVKEINTERSKSGDHAKTVYDQRNRLNLLEKQLQENNEVVEKLKAEINTYENRMLVISKKEEESAVSEHFRSFHSDPVLRANYDHVSRLLGRQVTADDLTLITGIGLRTSSLLQAKGIDTWEKLSRATVESLRTILTEAGGNYKTIDPTHWPRQAAMAAHSEWRKLRVFQETLQKIPE